MEYGLQMYSVRDITDKDLDGALKKVAEIGYKFVEFAGFFGHSAQEVKDMLDKYGLRVSGTHTGWNEVADHFEETVAYHKTIGNKNIIVPGADLSSQEKIDAFIKMANEFQAAVPCSKGQLPVLRYARGRKDVYKRQVQSARAIL